MFKGELRVPFPARPHGLGRAAGWSARQNTFVDREDTVMIQAILGRLSLLPGPSGQVTDQQMDAPRDGGFGACGAVGSAHDWQS